MLPIDIFIFIILGFIAGYLTRYVQEWSNKEKMKDRIRKAKKIQNLDPETWVWLGDGYYHLPKDDDEDVYQG